MKEEEKKGIVSALKGNFLLEVFKILKNGNFVDVKILPETGSVQLGVMSDFERALCTFMTKLTEEAGEIAKSMECFQGKSSENELKAKEKEIDMKISTAMLIKEIISNSFRTRNELWNIEGAIAIRSGFRIFKLAENKNTECNCVKCQLEKALPKGSFAIVEIVGPEGEESREMTNILSEMPASKYKH